ncbi:MAG: TonB-dependent receptor [Acidobacteria bacterium]|nr:TonB-dependent receptor [Acidobacteriota bacterium]
MSRTLISRPAKLILVLVLSCLVCASAPGSTPPEGNDQGTVAGVVVDVSTNRNITNATVMVPGTTIAVETDLDGNFTFRLKPGTYQVRVNRSGYQEHLLSSVIVHANQTTGVEAALSSEGMTLGEVVVTAENGGSGSEAGLLADRKAAGVMSDVISAREMSQDTSSNAAGILQRVVGISVVQDKYVYVRGLGERYSNTVLNDSLLPTTDPDRRVVPMDLMPAQMLENVKVFKTFTPDQPGEFSGGLVKIAAKDFPQGSSLKVSITAGANSQTSFRDFVTYPSDRLDWLGFGAGRRSLPSIIPADERLIRGTPFTPGFSPQQLQTFGRAFEPILEPDHVHARANQSYSVSGGTTIGKWGFVGGLTYSNQLHTLEENRLYYVLGRGGHLIPRSVFASDGFVRDNGLVSTLQGSVPDEFITNEFLKGYTSGSNAVRLGGTANVAYRLSTNHNLMFKNFYTHEGNRSTRTYVGWYESRGTPIRDERLRYLQEGIYSGQLSGEHVFPAFGNSVLAWRWNYSRATLDEPDLRENIYEFDQSVQRFKFYSQLQSSLRMFNTMSENLREPAVDWSTFFFFPNVTLNIKAGGSFSNRDRGFLSRRFRFNTRGIKGLDFYSPAEQLLAPGNIRPDGFEIFEETRQTDAYTGRHDIWAGYGMADFTLRKWRVIGGLRVERSDQQVLTFTPISRDPATVTAGQETTDLLPSIGLVYGFTGNINLRAGYSQTVSRPQFRELSPFEFTDVTGGPSAVGNPNLVRTKIRNYDLRWEWFFAPQKLIAVSFFYKDFTNPVEQVIQPSNELTVISYRNVRAAKNRGLEVEFRKRLGALSPRLENLSVMFNYTYVNSTVEIGEQEISVVTSLKRPLVGQSANVLNATVHYEIPRWNLEARTMVNYVGERISDVGAYGLPDIREKGFPTLDLFVSKRFLGEAKRMEAKFSGENLIDREVRFNQGPIPYWYFRRGRSFSVSLSYTFF